MEANDADYFKSYGNLGVHKLMLRDQPRTLAYKHFIEQNPDQFKDKVVLDVGAGTGILSLFAARAGARKVYAVEASPVADICKDIIAANKYSDVITVLNEKVEDVELPEKVDVIVSEWMGFYLLHESMLDSVLAARDKWLKPDGIMVPSHASISICPVNMATYCEKNFQCWKDMYGFDFTPILTQEMTSVLQQPAVTMLHPDQCLSKAEVLCRYDLKTVKLSEIQDIEERKAFEMSKDSLLHGFAAWFDVTFSPNSSTAFRMQEEKCNSNERQNGTNEMLDSDEANLASNSEESGSSHVTLSTAPWSAETHWQQTVCFLPGAGTVKKGETIYCKISLAQDMDNKRHYNISLEMVDSLEESSDEDYESDGDLDDTYNHPIPCDCGSGRCRIIGAIIEKYDEEQTTLEMEAEYTDVTAEVQAAETLDNDSSYLDSEGWNPEESGSNKEECTDSVIKEQDRIH